MKILESITEDSRANVIAAEFTDGTRLVLPEPFPRSELAVRAVALAAAYGVTLPPGFTPPAPTPAPEGNDSTPQGAD
jgi:hypothetical protein